MSFRSFFQLAPFALASTSLFAQTTIEEVVVTADFRESSLMETATSVTAVDSTVIEDRAADQLEAILNLAPNVNYSAGASRGRYIQIRGIGERSQFVDPITPSVGVIIDGVDFSTMGNAATLFDIDQVEILRGPQGTKFGSSALAGIVNIQSKAPSEETEYVLKLGTGNYNRNEIGASLSGSLSDTVQGRLSINQLKSDGFIKNTYLNRDDTNDLDELSAKAHVNWQLSEETQIGVSYFYLDTDNGYDAFSLENNRETLSDQPGHDRQQSDALSINIDSSATDNFFLEASIAFQDTDAEYGYDEDWTYTAICDGLACDSDDWGFDWWYSSTDNYQRNYESTELNLRAISKPGSEIFLNSSWVFGLNYKDNSQGLDRDFFDFDNWVEASFQSDFDTDSLSAYGEISTPISENLTLTIGSRAEDYNSDYNDSSEINVSPSETLWGGEVNITYKTDNTLVYGLLSRGYKPGGVNGNAIASANQKSFSSASVSFLENRLVYKTETANNFEIGVKKSYENLDIRASAFYVDRKNVQLRAWINEGTEFVGYTDNGATGTNTGAELEINYFANDRIALFSSIGLLDSKVENFSVIIDDVEIDKSGREQAHAPTYQFNLGANLALTETLSARIEVEGKDAFFFSDSHDQESDSFQLLHAQLAYQKDSLKLSFWGNNLTDEDYQVRGFYFANDPRDFYDEKVNYVQLGNPRTFGISATYNF